jgi:hypothetical protein
MVVATGVAGLLGAYFLPRSAEARLAAFVGVAGSVLAGAVVLPLKRRALDRGLNRALVVLGAAFVVRLVLVVAGLMYVVRANLGPLAFTLGFFGVYVVLQWVEISYVLAESKRRGQGGG